MHFQAQLLMRSSRSQLTTLWLIPKNPALTKKNRGTQGTYKPLHHKANRSIVYPLECAASSSHLVSPEILIQSRLDNQLLFQEMSLPQPPGRNATGPERVAENCAWFRAIMPLWLASQWAWRRKNIHQVLTLTLSASSTCVLASHIHLLTEPQSTVLGDHPWPQAERKQNMKQKKKLYSMSYLSKWVLVIQWSYMAW